MDSAERIRQLREQHQLVTRHLAWLEGEIAREETSELSGYTPSEPIAPTPPPPHSSSEPEPAIIAPGSSAADQARRSRSGCILAAVVGAAILLFLIWGLPHFLY